MLWITPEPPEWDREPTTRWTNRTATTADPSPPCARIAFLLERSRAETYKVKAFRAAADTILPLGDEVAERVRQGTLRELPGIGASTAEVIEAAVEGRMPDRLAKLEREVGGPLVQGGRGGPGAAAR